MQNRHVLGIIGGIVHSKTQPMFRNFFTIAVRQLIKQRMYSVVKIGGFALSIAACVLIALYIRSELSFDKSYIDGERIYRVTAEFTDNGKLLKGVTMPPPMVKALKKDFPEVEIAARLMPNTLFDRVGANYVKRSDQHENNYEKGFAYADQEILDILQIPMVYGKRAHALTEPNSMVISKTIADKYFPNQNPVGKLMLLNDDNARPVTIGGVMQDFPKNAHLQYDFLITLAGVELWPGEQGGWRSTNYVDYIKLRRGTDPMAFEKKLTSVIFKNYMIPSMIENGDPDAATLADKAALHIQPISDIYLGSYDFLDFQNSGLHGDIRFVKLFGAVACFILLIAGINFVNLSTAKSANRAKEVGLRKVVGSFRSSLIQQFLTESLLFSFLSFALGLLLAWIILPHFNTLSARSLTIPWQEWWLIPSMIVAAFVIGILAGIYPSFYLSSFKPISVLKGQLSLGSKNSILRNGLVVFQFATSIILIISTIVIYQQTQFILNRKLGFDKDQVILVQGTNTLARQVKTFRNELTKIPQVKSASISDYLPVEGTKRNGNSFYNEGKTKDQASVNGQNWIIDDSYIKTMGMKIVAGRNFSFEMPSDSQAVIINQSMASQLNLKDPIGKRITNGGDLFNIVGVVEDFNFDNMRQSIVPLCMHLGNSSSIISVKVNGDDMKATIAAVSSVWKSFAPEQPFRYTFLDDNFASMYDDVQRMSQIFTSFSVLAIVIACLGLFALSAFMAEQRNKEIGIRKILGASAASISTMLSKDFVKLIIISLLIASPLAWWAMTKWLEDYVYRINISWWMFALAGAAVVLIALITMSFQVIKSSHINPVKNLRSE